MGPNKAAKSAPPADLGIGGPFGPGGKTPPGFHLKPAKGPAADKARAQAATKKANDPIFKARQDRSVKSAINSRVAATAGLTPATSKPFGGSGAKDPLVPDLTAKTQLAKARAQRVAQGGLLTPAQAKREKAAVTTLATSRALNFLDRHNLANTQYGDLTQLQPAKPGPRLDLGAPAAPPEKPSTQPRLNPRAQLQAEQPGQGAVPKISDFLGRTALDALGHVTPILGGLSLSDSSKLGTASNEASRMIAAPQGVLPHIEIPKNFLSAEAQAASKGKPVFADQVQNLGHFSLTAAGRKQFEKMIIANGYNIKDAPTWNDQDYVTRAFIKNDTGVGATIRNAFADLGQQAGLANVPSMYGNAILRSIQQRSLAPIAQLEGKAVQGFIAPLPHFGDRPWLENLQERPITTIETLLPFAKHASLRIGKGLGAVGVDALRGERVVESPKLRRAVDSGNAPVATDTTVTLPASQEIITRGVQKLHDVILGHATDPSAAKRRPGVGALPPSRPAALAHDLNPGRLVGRLGNALENHMEANTLSREQQMARLQAGRDPHLALLRYMRSIRDLSWFKNRGTGGKLGAVEATVAHESWGTDAGQASEAFLTWAHDNHQLAAAFREDARIAQEAGKTVEADAYTAAAEQHEASARDLESQASLSSRHGYNLGKNKNLAKAARDASRQQTEMRVAKGMMDEPGALYGDLQHRLAIVRATEYPGSVRGGADGTAAWHVADRLLNHETGSRHAFIQARADLHGRTPAEEAAQPLDANLDPRSPEARYQLGRHQDASRLQQIAERRNNDRQQRQAEMLRNTQTFSPAQGEAPVAGAHNAIDVARAAATHAGVGIEVVDTVLRKAHQALHEMRGGVDRRHAELDQLAGQVEGTERRAHEAKGNETLRRLQTELDVAERAGSPPTRVQKIRDAITHEQSQLAAYKPSRDVLELRSASEKNRMASMVRELSGKQINKVIMESTTPEQRRGVGFQRLRDAVTQQMDSLVHPDLPQRLEAIKNDAAASYRGVTGKDVLKAQVYGKQHARYTEDLRAFKETQAAEGRDPFHARLHYPGESSALPPNMQATGEQFKTGAFTSDMHFYLAKDLEGLGRQAVQTKLMSNLSESSPLVLDLPPGGREIPAGWAYVSQDNWLHLKKANMDANQVQAILDGWRGTEAIPRVPPGDTGGVLISKNLQELLASQLQHNPHEISGLLKATNAYRRWMLYSLPRTFVNNALGNPILAMVAGAGIKSYIDSMAILRKKPELVMHTEMRKGPIANIMETDNAKMTGWQAFWRHSNTFAEDQNRLSVYLLHAKRAFKQENGLRWFNNVTHMNEHFVDYLTKAAKGENPDALKWAEKTAYIFGDMMKTYKIDPTLATYVLFHRWVGHMLYLQATMPFKYPGRTLFLQQTAILADQYRKEHGVFPDWASAYIPLWGTVEKAGGLPQSVTWALSTSGINPFSTPGQTFDMGTVGQTKAPAQSLLAANLSPLFRAPLEWAIGHRLDTLQQFKDQHGAAIDPLSEQGVMQGLNSVIANTPIVNTAFSRMGLSDNSVQVPALSWALSKLGANAGEYPAYKSAAVGDPSMNGPTNLNHGLGWWALSSLGAALGAPVRPLDAAGNRTTTSANRTAVYQDLQKSIGIGKRAKAFDGESKALWKRDPAAWRTSKYNPKSPNYQDPTK